MEKIIIENRSNLSMEEAMRRVETVIACGKSSKTSKGVQYCFYTAWEDGIGVAADKNKKSDRFVVVNGRK